VVPVPIYVSAPPSVYVPNPSPVYIPAPVYTPPPVYVPPSVYVPAPVSCQDQCDATPSCSSDPHEHGSYCKAWQDSNVCFGLYVLPYGGLCFQPNDPNCDDSKLTPLACLHDETCKTDTDCPLAGSYCMNDPTKTAPYVCHVPN